MKTQSGEIPISDKIIIAFMLGLCYDGKVL
jgi:hypothetical protein